MRFKRPRLDAWLLNVTNSDRRVVFRLKSRDIVKFPGVGVPGDPTRLSPITKKSYAGVADLPSR